MNEHIKEMIEVFSELSVVGYTLNEDNKAVRLLAILPDNVDMEVIAFESHDRV